MPNGAILESRHLVWADEAATAACAAALAAHPGLRDSLLTLQGDLGAGKTTFVRHLLRALGVQGRIKSPTYTLMEPYEAGPDGSAAAGALPIAHFDFYRFEDPHEWAEAGLRDVFAAPGLKLVEWPERAAGLLPAADLHLRIGIDADGQRRSASIDALSASGRLLLQVLQALPQAEGCPLSPAGG